MSATTSKVVHNLQVFTTPTKATKMFSLLNNVTKSIDTLERYCKNKGYEKPSYRIVSRNAKQLPDGVRLDKYYTSSVTVNGIHLAKGEGISKRIAYQKAAVFGLQQLRLFELHSFWTFYRNRSLEAKQIEAGPSNTQGNKKITKKNLEMIGSPDIEELIPPTATLPTEAHHGPSRSNSDVSLMLSYAIGRLRDNNLPDNDNHSGNEHASQRTESFEDNELANEMLEVISAIAADDDHTADADCGDAGDCDAGE